MNILILQKSLVNYSNAFYQTDIINVLRQNHKLFFYGPGYASYNIKFKAEDILSNFDSKIDLILYLHNSIEKIYSLSQFPNFKNINIKKIFFLNKEYSNLNLKLQFCVENKINLIVTHHHEASKYEEITGIKCLWLPFAVNAYRYKKYYDKFKDRPISLFTSGVIQNFSRTKKGKHDFDRIKLANIFYQFFFLIPIKKRKKYRKLNIELSFDYTGHSLLRQLLYIFKIGG